MPAAIDPVELTQRLVRINTMNPPGGEEAAARLLGELLAERGLAVAYHEIGPGRRGLVATLAGEGRRPPLCFTGHLDTVPLGEAPWRTDPLAGEIVGGRLYGRGSSDMKAGVAAICAAAVELARLAGRAADVALICTAAEETGSEGARAMAQSGILPALAGALIVAEPSGNRPFLGHKGALWLEATYRGKAAHGSMPDQGVNAIYKAAHAAASLEHFFNEAPAHPLLGHPTINLGTFQAGTKINMVPDLARFTIDLRTVPGLEHERVVERMREFLGRDALITRLMDVPAVLTDRDHPWVQEVLDTMAQTGLEAEPGYVNYFTDASVLAEALGGPPAIILGPGEPQLAHQTDEYCEVAKIQGAAQVYLDIARRWCGV